MKKPSVFRSLPVFWSLRKLGYDVHRIGSEWLGLSEIWVYKNGGETLDAAYIDDRKALVYAGLDSEKRRRLGGLAARLNLSFAYPLDMGDERVSYHIDGETKLAKHAKNIAFHEIVLGKQRLH